jgi:uncharacterized protein (DUF2062 family)
VAWPADCAVLLLAGGACDPAQLDLLEQRLRGMGTEIREVPSGTSLGMALATVASAGFRRAVVISQAEESLANVAALLAFSGAPAGLVLDGMGGEHHPLVLTSRPAASRWSRAGRRIAALGIWCCCGAWLPDPASPVRLYPLSARDRWRAYPRAGEGALLVRSAWLGLPIASLPVDGCEDVRDRAGQLAWHLAHAPLFAWLMLRRGWLWGRGPGDHHRLRRMLAAHLSPRRAALACALGAAMAVAPTPGLQMAIAAALAARWRLNLGLTLAASNLSLGPLLALWYAAATALGLRLIAHQPLLATFRQLHQLLASAHSWHERLVPLRECLLAWLLGSVLLMAVLALVAGVAGYLLVRLWQRRRGSAG